VNGMGEANGICVKKKKKNYNNNNNNNYCCYYCCYYYYYTRRCRGEGRGREGGVGFERRGRMTTRFLDLVCEAAVMGGGVSCCCFVVLLNFCLLGFG